MTLTEEEYALVELLGEVWNRFTRLSAVHGSDRAEFTVAIHAAQNIILSRPVMRELLMDPRRYQAIDRKEGD